MCIQVCICIYIYIIYIYIHCIYIYIILSVCVCMYIDERFRNFGELILMKGSWNCCFIFTIRDGHVTHVTMSLKLGLWRDSNVL